jgi:DNA-binding MarR family transcriptional regulator
MKVVPQTGRQAVPERYRDEMGDADLDVATIMMTLARLSRQVQENYQNDLRTLRTNYSEYAALHALVMSGAPYSMSPSKLNEWVGLSSGGITKTVDRLESDGMIVRSPDPNDGRGVLVTLTERGRRKAERIFETGLGHYSSLLAGVAPEERSMIARSLELLLDAFDAGAVHRDAS